MTRLLATGNQWDVVWTNRNLFAAAIQRTLWMAAWALVISLFTGLGLALLRLSRFRVIRWLAAGYVNFFRGAPIIVLVFWVYFGAPDLIKSPEITVFRAGVAALALMHTAFLSEIFRSGILAVPKGQREAALSLGMGRLRTFVSVVLPQAAKVAIPGAGNTFIGMVKDTSVFYAIGFLEILSTTKKIVSDTFIVFPLYTAALIIYVVIATVLDFGFRQLEKRLSRGDSRTVQRSRGLSARRRLRRIESLQAAVMTGRSTHAVAADASASAVVAVDTGKHQTTPVRPHDKGE